MDAGACPECGTPTVAPARFCGRCGAALAVAQHGGGGRAGDPDDDGGGRGEVGGVRSRSGRRSPAGAVAVVVAVLVVAVLAWPSSTPGDGERTGVAAQTPLPDELVLRWDVTVPGFGGPTSAGRPPARVGAGSVAVADVVVDAAGAPVAARPPGVLRGEVWAIAGQDGLVLGDAVTGRVTRTLPWSPSLAVTPVGAALAWVDVPGDPIPGDVVLATSTGGSVRLDAELRARWASEAVPVVGDRAVTSSDGPLVPARDPGADAPAAVMDLRDGQVVARVGGDLRLLAVGHGLVVTADGDDVVAAWPLPAEAGPVVLPGSRSPVWEVPMAPGRPVAVDVLGDGFVAIHGMDAVVGEVRLVDARDGTVLEVVAGWPNADLDGGRTAEAFDEVVTGVVGDELRRFAWDGTPLPAVPLGGEGWFVTRGDDLVQLVARRTGEVVLVDVDGVRLPAAAPPPSAGTARRVVAVGGSTVGIAGGVGAPTAVQWLDAQTGELGVAAPPGGAGRADAPPGSDPAASSERPGVLAVVGPLAGDLVVVEPAAVLLVDADDGTERWRSDLAARPALATLVPGAHPGIVVTSAHVVVPFADGTTTAIARADGTVAWTATTGVASAVVGAGDDVFLASVTGPLLRLAADGRGEVVADLGAAAAEVAIAVDVVVGLLPGRLVGIGPPGGPIPDEDRVELSAPTGPRRATVAPTWWHAATAPPSSTPGG